MKRKTMAMVVFVVIMLLVGSVDIAFASATVDSLSKDVLSASSTSQGNDIAWDKIHEAFVKQFNFDKDEILRFIQAGINQSSSTLAASKASLRDSYDNCVATVCYPWHTEGGSVNYEDEVTGTSNGNCAHLDAVGLGSEAFIVGQMNAISDGSISITCSRGGDTTGWWDFVSIYTSMYGDVWDRIDTYVTWDTLTEVDIGESSVPFLYVSIATWSFNSSYPQCIKVDSLSAEPYSPSFVLTISTDGHGTTDPAPGGYYYYGETAEVAAVPDTNYEFDYWDIDGNYQSTDNPIYQQTWDGDHYLTAHFTYVPPQQCLTISATGGGTTDPSPGTHWYNYDTGVEVDAVGNGFSYWLLDGEYVYTGSSIYLTMNQYYSLEAHFNEQLPTCEVTINAIEVTSQSLAETNVYVDSQYVGATNMVYSVANFQQHTIEGEFYAYVPQWQAYGSSWWTEVNGEFYDYWYSATVTPSSLHMTVTFVYICAK